MRETEAPSPSSAEPGIGVVLLLTVLLLCFLVFLVWCTCYCCMHQHAYSTYRPEKGSRNKRTAVAPRTETQPPPLGAAAVRKPARHVKKQATFGITSKKRPSGVVRDAERVESTAAEDKAQLLHHIESVKQRTKQRLQEKLNKKDSSTSQ